MVGVITQPDRPAGRGRVLTPPPVRLLADQLALPVIQPERLREPEAWETLQGWQPDLIVVAAFGQILRRNVLDLPRHGCINVHASLLPRWRGAAPIQAAILHGDPTSGVTIMQMDPGIDTGPMLAQRETPILPEDTAETLGARLADLGADLLVETLPDYLRGDLQPQPQPADGATYAGMLSKDQGALDFSEPADALERRVRAFTPWPGAFFDWQNQPMKVLRARVMPCEGMPAGARTIVDGCPAVASARGCLVLEEVQPAGKRPMSGKDFLRGTRGWTNP